MTHFKGIARDLITDGGNWFWFLELELHALVEKSKPAWDERLALAGGGYRTESGAAKIDVHSFWGRRLYPSFFTIELKIIHYHIYYHSFKFYHISCDVCMYIYANLGDKVNV